MHNEILFLQVLLLLLGGVVLAVGVWALATISRMRRDFSDWQETQDARHRTLMNELRELRKAAAPAPETAAAPPKPAPAAAVPAAASQPIRPQPVAAPATPVPPPPMPAAAKPEPATVRPADVPPPIPPLPPQPRPMPPPAAAEEAPPNPFEEKARLTLTRIWNWFIYGTDEKPAAGVETAIATNWLLRLGILAFLLFIGFGLKYSIDHGLLGPEMRIALALCTGAALIAGGLRLFGRQYHLLGQGAVGAGFATLYFSIFASFQFYHFLLQLPAFGLMALVTVATGFLAVRFNSLLVALIGLIGGYATPLLINTGEKNLPGLYAYLVLLGAGVLVVALRRRWHLLNLLAMGATYFLYFGALDRFYERTADFPVALGFLMAFFVLFSTISFVSNVVQKEKSSLVELLMMLANAAVTAVAGVWLITDARTREEASLLTVGYAAFYLVHLFLFLRQRRPDRGFLVTLLMLAAGFLSVTVPLLFNARWVTAAWAVQALVMLWASCKLNSRFLRGLAYLLYLAAFAKLFTYDLYQAYGDVRGTLLAGEYLRLFLERVGALGVPLASLAGAWRLLLRPPAPHAEFAAVPEKRDAAEGLRPETPKSGMAAGFLTVGLLLAFLLVQFEVNRCCGLFCEPLRLPALTAVWFAACVAFLVRIRRGASRPWETAVMVALSALMLAKFLLVDLYHWHPLIEGLHYRLPEYRFVDVFMRALDFGLLCTFFGWGWRSFSRLGKERSDGGIRTLAVIAGILTLGLLFVWLTLETGSALQHFVPGMRPGGISILWALFALSLVLAGIRSTTRALRFTGLTLFAIVAVKVFFSDLAHLDAIYRIIALPIVAALLISGSFVYLKYRQNNPPPEDKNP